MNSAGAFSGGLKLTVIDSTTLERLWTVDIYTIFDGLTCNTRGYFTSCVVFSKPRSGEEKIRAMSNVSARTLNPRIRDLLFH